MEKSGHADPFFLKWSALNHNAAAIVIQFRKKCLCKGELNEIYDKYIPKPKDQNPKTKARRPKPEDQSPKTKARRPKI